MKIDFKINGKNYSIEENKRKPLLWVLRDNLGFVGTKYGCGRGLCGACTIHLNGRATRSCILPISAVAGKEVTTIEGLAKNESELHPLQEAWIEQDVPQCGYCQAGQIMTAAALLNDNSNPSDDEIDSAMAGNICRCGTYKRIRKAIQTTAANGGSK